MYTDPGAGSWVTWSHLAQAVMQRRTYKGWRYHGGARIGANGASLQLSTPHQLAIKAAVPRSLTAAKAEVLAVQLEAGFLWRAH